MLWLVNWVVVLQSKKTSKWGIYCHVQIHLCTGEEYIEWYLSMHWKPYWLSEFKSWKQFMKVFVSIWIYEINNKLPPTGLFYFPRRLTGTVPSSVDMEEANLCGLHFCIGSDKTHFGWQNILWLILHQFENNPATQSGRTSIWKLNLNEHTPDVFDYTRLWL